MRKISGGGGGVGVGVGGGVVGSPSFPQPASLSSLPSTVSSPVRGTLVVDGRGVVFSYRVFGFKSKVLLWLWCSCVVVGRFLVVVHPFFLLSYYFFFYI